MAQSEDIIRVGNRIPEVAAVETRTPYILVVTFTDGKITETRMVMEELTGVFQPMRDPDFFAMAFVDPETKTVAWPNGVDLDPCVLYDPSLRDARPAERTQQASQVQE